MKKTETFSKKIHHYHLYFENLSHSEEALQKFQTPEFKNSTDSYRFNLISQTLVSLIDQTPAPCFLLPALTLFIDQVNSLHTGHRYTFSALELWLNQFSNLTPTAHQKIRGKIMGQYIAREKYQNLFPIGNNKTYFGSHYITAHSSPDLDTTIASFWGWVDAFAAKIGSGLHIWNVPEGGILSSLEASPLTDLIGKNLFTTLSQNSSSLSPISIDFISQKNLVKKSLSGILEETHLHERDEHPTLVVDEHGHFVGDLRDEDYQAIGQISRLLVNGLQSFQNQLLSHLIHIFSKTKVSKDSIIHEMDSLFKQSIHSYLEHSSTSDHLKQHTHNFLEKMLGLKEGSQGSFNQLAAALKKLQINKLSELESQLSLAFTQNHVFGTDGSLKETRPDIFKSFDQMSIVVNQAIDQFRDYMSRVEIAIGIKKHVLGHAATYVTSDASLQEVLDKLRQFDHLSVVMANKDGSFWPLGIIKAEEVRKPTLGTVSLRDFSNRNEVHIDSQLEVISVMDHHKLNLKTSSPIVAHLADVQSCNTIAAEEAFKIHDQYLFEYQSKESLVNEMQINQTSHNHAAYRLQNRILKKLNATFEPKEYFIHSQRALFEYLSYIHAIIDDTDLFSKMTPRDLTCVTELLNRIKSIHDKKEVEVLHFDDIENNAEFMKKAVQKLVKNHEMYAIYSGIFEKREKDIEQALKAAVNGKSFEIFSDTKEQNGCCRVGQTKFFAQNSPTLENHLESLIEVWWKKAQESHQSHSFLDLHIHMVSTIPNADDVYKEGTKNHSHKDYLWIWAPHAPQAIAHLTYFLNAFKNCAELRSNHIQFQVLTDEKADVDYEGLLKHHFLSCPSFKSSKIHKKMPVIILSFDAGTLNSRKVHITPFLPNIA